MRELGLLTAVTILLVLIAAFVVLPLLLVLWRSTTDGEPRNSDLTATTHRQAADRLPGGRRGDETLRG